MIINRYIPLNPLEPAPLSMRAAKKLPLTVNFSFRTLVTNDPITYDLKGKIVLTGRTNGERLEYEAPSTDISNGKATAVIPADMLTDCNGYQVQLFGEPQTGSGPDLATASAIVAIGVLRLIEG